MGCSAEHVVRPVQSDLKRAGRTDVGHRQRPWARSLASTSRVASLIHAERFKITGQTSMQTTRRRSWIIVIANDDPRKIDLEPCVTGQISRRIGDRALLAIVVMQPCLISCRQPT